MRSTMLDRLRQGERLWIDQRRTPPACRCAPVCDRLAPECSDSRASQNSTSRAGAGGCVRPCWSRLARSDPRSTDQWRRRERRDCPGLGPGIPSVLPRPAGQLPPFFLHERPELIDFHLGQVQIAGQHLRQGLGMGRCPAHATR